jgi:hypothetical protein
MIVVNYGMGTNSTAAIVEATRHEIDRMAAEEPEMLARALEIEDAARASGQLLTVKGLGRSFSWREYLEGKAPEACDTVEEECGCYDGEAA